MKEAEDEVHERLDQLGMMARGCQASGLVEWLDGQEQGNRKSGERRKRHKSDATPRLGVEPQAVVVRAAMLRQYTRPLGGFDQHGMASSPDGHNFPHTRCPFIGSLDRCLGRSMSHALIFQAQPAVRWDTLDGAEGYYVTD